MKQLTLGFSACLDERRSAHARSFSRAVQLACEWVAANLAIEIVPLWVDDGASHEGGARAAREIVRSNVRAVVGHFASAAAAAAMPVYSEREVAAYLPAATAASLRSYRCVRRLCDADDDYAHWIRSVLTGQAWRKVAVLGDGSTHAESVRAALQREWPEGIAEAERAEAVLFSGMLATTLEFVNSRGLAGDRRPLLVTDDAQAEDFARAVQDRAREFPLYVLGFVVRPTTAQAAAFERVYRDRWGCAPGIYFYETVSAVQVAVQAMTGVAAEHYDTAIGKVRFDSQGESRPGRFMCYRIEDGRFAELGAEWS